MKKLMFALVAMCGLVASATPVVALQPQGKYYAVDGEEAHHEGWNGDLATTELSTTYNSGYQWYCYPGDYTISSDLNLQASIGFYLSTSGSTFDFTGKTLKTPSSGFGFMHSINAGSDVYFTLKGGTLDFSNVGNWASVKLLGNGTTSIVGSHNNYIKQHGVVDGTTIYTGLNQVKIIPMMGTGESSVTLKGATINSPSGDFYAVQYAAAGVSAGSVSNTLAITEKSSISVPTFYADGNSSDPSESMDVASTIIVDDSTLNITGSRTGAEVGTLYLGQVYSGNYMLVTNNAKVTVGGYGLVMGVNKGVSWNNTLEIADGGTVDCGTHNVSLGHNSGSSYNRLFLRKGGVLTASSVGLNSQGNATVGYMDACNEFIVEPGATLNLSSKSGPVNLRGNSSHVSIANGAELHYNSFDLSAQVDSNGDCIGCTNNTFEISNGTKVYLDPGWDVSLQIGNNGTKVPAVDATLSIGNDSLFKVTGQFFNSGMRNTISVSNGCLQCTYNSEYSFYIGNGNCTKLGSDLTGNKVVIAGDHPEIVVTNNVKACISLASASVVELNLPESLEYKTIPFRCGQFQMQNPCRFKIPNIDAIRAAMTKDSVKFTIVDALTSVENAIVSYPYICSELPAGCAMEIVTDEETGHKQLILTVSKRTTKVAEITSNGANVNYYSYEAAAEALKDGDKLTLVDPVLDEPLVINGKSFTFNNNRLAKDLQLEDGAHMIVTNQSLQYGNSMLANAAIENYALTLSGQSQLDVYGQFMICGTNNTLTIDDSRINVWYQYATYISHSGGEGKSNSADNYLIIKGYNPVIRSYEANGSGVNFADSSVGSTCHVTFELPTNPEDIYPEAVFQSGHSAWFDCMDYEFKNIEELQKNLTSAIYIPISMVDGTGAAGTGTSASFNGTPRVALPGGCKFVGVRDSEKGTYTMCLYLPPLRAASVNGVSYVTWAEAVDAANDGDTIKAEATVDPATISTTKSLILDRNGYAFKNVTLDGAGKIRMSQLGYNMGYDAPTPGQQNPAYGYSLTLSDGMTLELTSQFMCCGTNNTLVIDNALLSVTNYQYAFYFGHEYLDSNPGVSADNHVMFKGQHPQIVAWNDEAANTQISFQNCDMTFDLTEGVYTEPVFISRGSVYLYDTVTVTFKGLEDIQAKLVEEGETIDMPLIRSAVDTQGSISFCGDKKWDLNGTLPAGCYVYVTADQKEAFLHIGPEEDALFDGQGCGSEEDPFIIDDADDLVELKERMETMSLGSVFFKQTEDLELTDWEGIGGNYAGSLTAVPYLAFRGTYDGNGCNITLQMKDGLKYAGLFNTIHSGTVKNLNVEMANDDDHPVKGAAGIVGVIDGSSSVISNCFVSGVIVGTHNIGGICVKILGGTQILDSGSSVSITTSGTKAGGVAAFYQQETDTVSKWVVVSNFVNEGSIVSTSEDATSGDVGVGGIIGWSKNNLALFNVENQGDPIEYDAQPKKAAEIIGAVGGSDNTEATVVATNCTWATIDEKKGYGTKLSSNAKIYGLDGNYIPEETEVLPGEETYVEEEPTDDELETYVPALNQEQASLDEDAQSTYKSYFKATKKEVTEGEHAGSWAIVVDVIPEKAEELKTDADTDSAKLLVTPGEEGTASVKTVPGFYYSVATGTAPQAKGLEEGDRKMATEDSMDLDVPAIEGNHGFYQIRINATAE